MEEEGSGVVAAVAAGGGASGEEAGLDLRAELEERRGVSEDFDVGECVAVLGVADKFEAFEGRALAQGGDGQSAGLGEAAFDVVLEFEVDAGFTLADFELSDGVNLLWG